MADNVSVTSGAYTATIAADEVTDATLGTVEVQYVKVMDGTLNGTNKLSVDSAGSVNATLKGKTYTGSIAALNDTVTISDLEGASTVNIQLVGSPLNFTVSAEGTLDGTTWGITLYGTGFGNDSAFLRQNFGSGAGGNSIVYNVEGLVGFRIKCTAYTNGSCTAYLRTAYTLPHQLPLVRAQTTSSTILADSSGRLISVGGAANGSAVSGNPVLTGGSDGTNARTIKTDTSGNLVVTGAAADGAAVSGNPVLVAAKDNAGNVATIASDTSGRQIVIGAASVGASWAGYPVLMGGTDIGGLVTSVLTDTVGRPIVVGAAAAGSAVTGNPVLVACTDGTNARSLKSDGAGVVLVQGYTAVGNGTSGNPVLVGASDGTNVRNLRVDSSGFLVVGAGSNKIGAVSLGNSTGKTIVGNTGSLVTTATTADQVIVTYTVTAGKTFYVQAITASVRLTTYATTATNYGTVSVETPSGTKKYTEQLAHAGIITPMSIVFDEPLPIAASTVIRIVCTPAAATSFTWRGNIIGYEI